MKRNKSKSSTEVDSNISIDGGFDVEFTNPINGNDNDTEIDASGASFDEEHSAKTAAVRPKSVRATLGTSNQKAKPISYTQQTEISEAEDNILDPLDVVKVFTQLSRRVKSADKPHASRKPESDRIEYFYFTEHSVMDDVSIPQTDLLEAITTLKLDSLAAVLTQSAEEDASLAEDEMLKQIRTPGASKTVSVSAFVAWVEKHRWMLGPVQGAYFQCSRRTAWNRHSHRCSCCCCCCCCCCRCLCQL
jgi:hypothetical protein